MAGVPVPTAAALASPFLVLLVGVGRADQQQPAPFLLDQAIGRRGAVHLASERETVGIFRRRGWGR